MADRKNEAKTRLIRPAAFCVEEEGNIVLLLDMPGVTRENLEVEVEDNQLTITGRRPPAKPDVSYLVKERIEGDYQASYTVDDTIDPQKIEAKLENGVLTVTLYVKEAVKPRRIAVKAG